MQEEQSSSSSSSSSSSPSTTTSTSSESSSEATTSKTTSTTERRAALKKLKRIVRGEMERQEKRRKRKRGREASMSRSNVVPAKRSRDSPNTSKPEMSKKDDERFKIRSALQIERMVCAFDSDNNGPTKRLHLKDVHALNGHILPCRFYNINQCYLPYKNHKEQGKEVEHCCSDCLYVVPGMILRHRAETPECPIFRSLQRFK